MILQVADKTEFNPETDHFYPIPLSVLRQHIGSKHASGEYQLNFDLTGNKAGLYRDDLQAAMGLQLECCKDDVSPSGTNQLREIAREFCNKPGDKNENLDGKSDDFDNEIIR